MKKECCSQERADVNIREAARLFHEKEADTKRKEQASNKKKYIKYMKYCSTKSRHKDKGAGKDKTNQI